MEVKKVKQEIEEMDAEMQQIALQSDFDIKREELARLDETMLKPDFWDDSQAATKIINKQAELKNKLDNWNEIIEMLEESSIMLEMLADTPDVEMEQEFEHDYELLKNKFDSFTFLTLFSDDFDENNCFVDIHSGEGGVDSQDFAQLLMRMYMRWAERNNVKCEVISFHSGDEAGIKSCTMYMQAPYTYGKLKGEIGVHRLVRLSPFDTAKRRHTSFASVAVTPEIDNDIEIVLNDSELKIDTYRSSGAGGQSVNTTDSAVRITHLPTGIVVTCQNERSQIQNKEQALKILKSKLYEFELEKQNDLKSESQQSKKEIGFGSQIRSYIMHPYQMVKDHRTNFEVGNIQDVLDGNFDGFIESYLKSTIEQ